MHIIICGFSRSGSTMLHEMLRTTVKGYKFLESERRGLSIDQKKSENIITKRPLDIFSFDDIVAEKIIKKHEDVGFIITIRDPRSLVTSKHQAVPNDFFMDKNLTYFVPGYGHEPYPANPGVIPTYKELMYIQQMYTEEIQLRRPIAIVRYEDLVQETAMVQESLGNMFELEFDGKFEDFWKYDVPTNLMAPLNGVRQVDLTRIEAWKNYPARIVDQFDGDQVMLEMVRKFGYVKNDQWLEEIKKRVEIERA